MAQWILKQNSIEDIRKYSERLKTPDYISSILINRGFNLEDANLLINKNHELINSPTILTNAEQAALKIKKHIDNGSAIRIFADYDVDGLTSGYVLESALKECSDDLDIETYYPDRSEGYGINMDWCRSIVKSKDKDILVITVDNGTTKVEETDYLIKNGVDVLITDHHESSSIEPKCLIVNPHNNHQEQSKETLGLCGCGVAFKVAQIVQAYYKKYNMLSYSPYLALATIADVMPMTLENIAFINYGLLIINSDKCPENLKAFKEYVNKDEMNAKDLAFDISPKLNSCGRINNINIAKEFLFEENKEEIIDKMHNVIKADNERKKYEKETMKKIDKLPNTDDKVIIVVLDDCPVGVLGVIANKVVKKFNRPAFVLKEFDGVLTGSARSIPEVDLLEAVRRTSKKDGLVINFGGHSAALGISIYEDNIEAFKEEIESHMEFEEVEELPVEVDAVIQIKDINMDISRELSFLPFNNRDLPAPILALDRVKVKKYKLSSNNPLNICFTVEDETGTLDIWAWGFGKHYVEELNEPQYLSLAGAIEPNFMNPKFATMNVVDIKG